MEIINLSIDQVKPYERNPRRNEGAVKAVAESIKQFGWQQPLVVDQDNVLIVGHTRLKAAKKLGLKEVPVLVAANLSEEQVKKYRILDNKTNELSEWDFNLLKTEIEDFKLDFTGFDVDFGLNFAEGAFGQSGSEDGYNEFDDEEDLPEELQGVDLEPDVLPRIEGDGRTALERVIIVFPAERKQEVAQLLRQEELSKVVYQLEDILG
jgi:hypothetical protein